MTDHGELSSEKSSPVTNDRLIIDMIKESMENDRARNNYVIDMIKESMENDRARNNCVIDMI